MFGAQLKQIFCHNIYHFYLHWISISTTTSYIQTVLIIHGIFHLIKSETKKRKQSFRLFRFIPSIDSFFSVVVNLHFHSGKPVVHFACTFDHGILQFDCTKFAFASRCTCISRNANIVTILWHIRFRTISLFSIF